MSEWVLQASGLRKTFGRVVAVDDVSFSMRPGELVGLVGPNGAGKSTTIRMLAGQLEPTAGSAVVAGIDVASDPVGARHLLGYVPERPDLYDYLTAEEMIDFVVELRGTGDRQWALDLAGLGEDAKRLIREYSQGMHRKTAIATALVARPKLVILDEALNGLDPPSVDRVFAALGEIREAGGAVLLSTHLLDTLEKVADRIVMMGKGCVVADVPPSQLADVRVLFES